MSNEVKTTLREGMDLLQADIDKFKADSERRLLKIEELQADLKEASVTIERLKEELIKIYGITKYYDFLGEEI